MILVFNASPLIVLAKAGLLDDVLKVADQAFIPLSVAQEIAMCSNSCDPARKWIESEKSQKHLVDVKTISNFVIAWDLGAGESSVISFMENIPLSYGVLDDLAARRCAAALQLKVIGTLGLLLLASKKGIFPSLQECVHSVIAAGLFISPKHLEAILAEQ
jgi:predicted nucleic acid-binding protein